MNKGVANTQSTDFPYDVYTGIWTNWSYGKVMGSTLTLTQSDANFLIAFVAFFITIVTTHIWKITCFGIHAFLSTSEIRDVLHHQRQVLLRNNQGPSWSLFSLIKLGVAWNEIMARQGIRRLLPLIILSGTLTAVLAIATGFSSRVATSNEVLLQGSNCAMPLYPAHYSYSAYLTEYQPYLANHMTQSEIYATQCYSETGTSGASCGIFTKPRLPVVVDSNAPCPFSDLCYSNTSLVLDTGPLDSHEDLGINAPVNERYSERRVLQCAPLKVEGYSDRYNVSGDRSYTRYYYGPQGGRDYSFMAPNDGFYEVKLANVSTTGRADYSLGVSKADYVNGSATDTSNFIPIPQLRQSGGNIIVLYLTAYGVVYVQKTLDPWYQATRIEGKSVIKSANYSGTSDSVEIYGQDKPGSPLACTHKVQFCFRDIATNYCTPLGTADDALSDALRVTNDQRLNERLNWTASASQGMSSEVVPAVTVLGAQSLLSRTTLQMGMQGPLPDTQWQIDMEHLFNIALSSLQKTYVELAAGPPSTYSKDWIRQPSTAEETNICHSQKVISNAHVSFSFFGLLFILITGSVIIAISIFLESLAVLVMKLFKFEISYGRYEWISNGALQLQRLAYAEAGVGQWYCGDETVPLTRSVTDLPPLDLSDEENPRVMTITNQKGVEGETDDSTKDDGSVDVHASGANTVLEKENTFHTPNSRLEGRDSSAIVRSDSPRRSTDTTNDDYTVEHRNSVEEPLENGKTN